MAGLAVEALPAVEAGAEGIGDYLATNLEKTSVGQGLLRFGRAIGNTASQYQKTIVATSSYVTGFATDVIKEHFEAEPVININTGKTPDDEKEEINKAIDAKIKAEGFDNPSATQIPKTTFANTMSNVLSTAPQVVNVPKFNINTLDYLGVSLNPMGNPLDILNLFNTPAAPTQAVPSDQPTPQPLPGNSGGVPL